MKCATPFHRMLSLSASIAILGALGSSASALPLFDRTLGSDEVRGTMQGFENVLHRGTDVTKSGSTWKSTVKIQNSAGGCTGVFIENDVLIASAHCFKAKQNAKEAMAVTFFEGANAVETKLVEGTDFIVERHPDYDDKMRTMPGASAIDIAVVTFKSDKILPLTHAAARPLSARHSHALGYGLAAVVVGSGRDIRKIGTKLQYAVGSIVDPYSASLIIELTEGAGACVGDSGGPVFVPTTDGYRLAGLVSQTPAVHEMANQCGFLVYATLLSGAHYKWLMEKVDVARAMLRPAPKRRM